MATMSTTHEMTAADAEQLMGLIAKATLAITRAEAKREAQVQRAKDACAEETAEARRDLKDATDRLERYILGHQGKFRKVRMLSCTWGRYGLRSSTRTNVTDERALIDWLRENGYADLVKVVESPIGKGVTKLLRDGVAVEGAELVTGEFVKYDLDTAILEQL